MHKNLNSVRLISFYRQVKDSVELTRTNKRNKVTGEVTEGTWSTGTLFLDMYNKADFSDRISYIFGHNIWDKTKFYDLRKFEDKTFFNIFFYIIYRYNNTYLVHNSPLY